MIALLSSVAIMQNVSAMMVLEKTGACTGTPCFLTYPDVNSNDRKICDLKHELCLLRESMTKTLEKY